MKKKLKITAEKKQIISESRDQGLSESNPILHWGQTFWKHHSTGCLVSWVLWMLQHPHFLETWVLIHGLLYTRTEDSRPFFSKSEPAGISKNGSNIICKSLKSKHFLFYAQGCGAKIKPAIPFWNINFKSPWISQFLS